MYQVADAFLQAVEDGVEDLTAIYNAPPPAATRTAEDIRDYGAAVTARLRRWWDGVADKSCSGTLKTYYGAQPMHHVLERSTWHSAQHTRQLAAVLERFGIEPDGPLSPAELAGLPLPVGLWE